MSAQSSLISSSLRLAAWSLACATLLLAGCSFAARFVIFNKSDSMVEVTYVYKDSPGIEFSCPEGRLFSAPAVRVATRLEGARAAWEDGEPAPRRTAPMWYEDTSVADTSVADSSVADTSVADTSVADSSVADTSVADSSVADTSVADSSVTDNNIAGTNVAATNVPASTEGLAPWSTLSGGEYVCDPAARSVYVPLAAGMALKVVESDELEGYGPGAYDAFPVSRLIINGASGSMEFTGPQVLRAFEQLPETSTFLLSYQ